MVYVHKKSLLKRMLQNNILHIICVEYYSERVIPKVHNGVKTDLVTQVSFEFWHQTEYL
jgi:hypothetical protein